MNLAVVEMNDATFNAYAVALTVSGVILLVLAIGGFFKASGGARVFSAIAGLAFLGYALYLFFLFSGGTVFISYYVFAVPVIVIVNLVRSRKDAKVAANAVVNPAATPGAPPVWPAPAQPAQGWPAPAQPAQAWPAPPAPGYAPGQPVAGWPAQPGQPMPGQPVAGWPAQPAQPMPGQPVAGWPAQPGQPMPGQPVAGWPAQPAPGYAPPPPPPPPANPAV